MQDIDEQRAVYEKHFSRHNPGMKSDRQWETGYALSWIFDHWKRGELKKKAPHAAGELSMLDVGCGLGETRSIAHDRGIKVWRGCDIVAHPSLKEHMDYLGYGMVDLPYGDESFDIVGSFDVAEHVDELTWKQGFHEMKRIARHHILVSLSCKESTDPRIHVNVHDPNHWIDWAARVGGKAWDLRYVDYVLWEPRNGIEKKRLWLRWDRW